MARNGCVRCNTGNHSRPEYNTCRFCLLQGSVRKHSPLVKEAKAIIEAIRHWRHYLTKRHLIHKAHHSILHVDKRHKGSIKNEKFLSWRRDLSCCSFDIISLLEVTTSHQMPCPEPSALPQLRTHFTSFTSPSVIWGSLNHLVWTKNLPSFLEEIRKPGEGSTYRGHPDFDRLTVDKYGYIVPLFTCFTRRNVRVCPLRSRGILHEQRVTRLPNKRGNHKSDTS